MLTSFLLTLKTKTNEAVVRFETEPGEQMQVAFTVIRRGRDPLLAFVATLGWSRASYVLFSRREENCSSITQKPLSRNAMSTALASTDRILRC